MKLRDAITAWNSRTGEVVIRHREPDYGAWVPNYGWRWCPGAKGRPQPEPDSERAMTEAMLLFSMVCEECDYVEVRDVFWQAIET